MTVIYIDALLILNLYVTFFLLKATAVFCHTSIGTGRLLISSALGALSSLLILLPALPYMVSVLIKIAVGIVIVLAAFGYEQLDTFLKTSLIFIVLNMVFAGLMLLLWSFGAPLGMRVNNGYSYFDISFVSILLSTLVAYHLIKLMRYLLDTRLSLDTAYTLEITYNGKTARLSAFADTGNKAADYFTGQSVIICWGDKLCDIIPQDILDYTENSPPVSGIRLMPYQTVGHSGIIPIFKPDQLTIHSDKKPPKSVNALVGISHERFTEKGVDAIFNPKLLI